MCSDVGACGTTVWEILTGEVPWVGKTHEQLKVLVAGDFTRLCNALAQSGSLLHIGSINQVT